MIFRFKLRARVLVGLVVLLAIGVNVVAYLHARSMTRWSTNGQRTQKPEQLGLLERVAVLATGVNIPRPDHLATPADVGLGFERHTYRSASGHDIEAWYIPSSGSRVLFVGLHGYAASKAALLPLAAALHELGYACLLVDFFGSGGSSGGDTGFGVREALDVEASVTYCRQRWPETKIVLYGQSMGGAAALRGIARRGIQPDALVLESTFDRLTSTTANRFRAMKLPGTPFAQLLVFWGGLSAGINGFDHNPVEYATAVHAPTLVLHGRHDTRVTQAQARSVYTSLTGWKRFVEFADAGHDSIRSSDPALWRSHVEALVQQVQPSSSALSGSALGWLFAVSLARAQRSRGVLL